VTAGTTRPLRLRVRAHDPTARASDLVFADDGPLLSPTQVAGPARVPVPAGAGPALCGPEPACGQTAERQGWPVRVSPLLRGPDFGSWSGRTLGEVAELDPAGLAAWLGDPEARPHGGESLAGLVGRVADLLQHPPPAGDGSGERPRVWVATPLVVRALVVAALGAPAAVIFAVDVAFGGEVLLSGAGGRWRLQGLSRR
jgi:broad specificity phosphatase PhoE